MTALARAIGIRSLHVSAAVDDDFAQREILTARIAIAPSGCWEWAGSRNRDGYGTIWFHGASRVAHRLSWMLHVGEIPVGMFVCHRCDNPPCINPEHLFLGTHRDNTDDMIAKGRANPWPGIKARAEQLRTKTHCKHGHEFTPESTSLSVRASGTIKRRCIVCSRLRHQGLLFNKERA